MAVYHLDCAQLKEAAPSCARAIVFCFPARLIPQGTRRINGLRRRLRRENHCPLRLRGRWSNYAGPTPAPAHLPIGSCGPTTSGRMDVYTPDLLDHGIAAMIGKGERSQAVCEAICKNGAVYLCAVGGAGALAAKCIDSCDVIAYEDLGCESVKKLHFKEFPLTVAIDCTGGNLFERS